MSKAAAMLAFEPASARAPSRVSASRGSREHHSEGAPSRENREDQRSRAPWGALYCWVRQGQVRARQCWRPWWLLGLIEVVTYPEPAAERALFVPRMAASCGLPARAPMLVLLAARS